MFAGMALRGLHRFLEEDLLKTFVKSGLSRDEWDRVPAADEPCLQCCTDPSVSENRRRGPPQWTSKNNWAYGTAAHKGLQRAVNRKVKNESKIPLKIRLILRAFKACGYTPKKSEVIVGWPHARIGTSLDLTGETKEGSIVVGELDTDNGKGYHNPSFLLPLPHPIRISRCQKKLLQAFCGSILWKKYNPSSNAIFDVLMIHSPNPSRAYVYRVPQWMAQLAKYICIRMCASRDKHGPGTLVLSVNVS